MWAYDRQQGKCIRFWYGSCEGNGNRFETEQQCQETCVSPKGIGKILRKLLFSQLILVLFTCTEVCLLPKMTGPCQATSIRYYYNREKNECQQFQYGGCNGNENNYQTLEQCQTKCKKETIEQCTQPVQAGSCKGEYTRFYYDTVTGQCRSFSYGGCGKNQNHFLTLKDCLNRCFEPREKGTTNRIRNLSNRYTRFSFQRYLSTTENHWYMSRTSTNLVFRSYRT